VSSSLETNLEAAQFDADRALLGLPDNLLLYSTTPAAGYQPPVTISGGWTAGREKDSLDETQFYAVRIAMTDANAAILTAAVRRSLSAISIGNLRYIKKDVVPEFEEPLVLIIQAEPTGEKLA
jgi:hypothetical protein